MPQQKYNQVQGKCCEEETVEFVGFVHELEFLWEGRLIYIYSVMQLQMIFFIIKEDLHGKEGLSFLRRK